jgi:hypothetical protein
VATEVDELFTMAPAEFVPARNALAKALKADGHRDEAAAVAALRRPTVPDWALNSVALQDPDVVADAVDAAEHLRSVQAAALGDPSAAPDLREAMAQARQASGALRKAAEDVLRRAGRPAGDMSALTSRLNETMVHPGLLSQLHAGRLGTAAVDALDPFSGAPAAPSTSAGPARSGRAAARPPRAPAAPTARKAAAPKPPPPKVERVDERAERQARRAAELLERRRAQAAERLARADAVVDEAKAAVHDAEAEVKAAAAALERARRAETAARTRFERADAQRSEVAARVATLDD